MKSLMKQILESPNEDNLMAELFPKDDGKEYQEISQDAKDIDVEQGNVDVRRQCTVQVVLQ